MVVVEDADPGALNCAPAQGVGKIPELKHQRRGLHLLILLVLHRSHRQAPARLARSQGERGLRQAVEGLGRGARLRHPNWHHKLAVQGLVERDSDFKRLALPKLEGLRLEAHGRRAARLRADGVGDAVASRDTCLGLGEHGPRANRILCRRKPSDAKAKLACRIP